MTTKISSRPTFGGHEKFSFRQGWLKKGLDSVFRDPVVFNREDAFVTLGVGKNMAASIRYWGLALGLLQESPSEAGRGHELHGTALGQAMLADNGWDPYLEDINSLWVLHWQLANNKERGLIWYLVFSRYFDVEFRKITLMEFVKKQLTQMGIQTTEGMIEREIDVFLRTYIPTLSKKGKGNDESLDCPLVDLNLLRSPLGEAVYRFDIGPKPSMSVSVFGYALCSFLAEKAIQRRTATVDECVYTPGSPGQIFKLDENSVMVYLEELETQTAGALRIQETAGVRQMYLHDFSPELGWNLLQGYYYA